MPAFQIRAAMLHHAGVSSWQRKQAPSQM